MPQGGLGGGAPQPPEATVVNICSCAYPMHGIGSRAKKPVGFGPEVTVRPPKSPPKKNGEKSGDQIFFFFPQEDIFLGFPAFLFFFEDFSPQIFQAKTLPRTETRENVGICSLTL